MRICSTVQPGQPGAKRLLPLYDDRLVCVRYRYDEQRQKRVKTVELIVEEDNWESRKGYWSADRVVQLRVPWSEVEVRQRVKGAGGRWDPASRLWALRYDRVIALGLGSQIVEAGSGKRKKPQGLHNL